MIANEKTGRTEHHMYEIRREKVKITKRDEVSNKRQTANIYASPIQAIGILDWCDDSWDTSPRQKPSQPLNTIATTQIQHALHQGFHLLINMHLKYPDCLYP